MYAHSRVCVPYMYCVYMHVCTHLCTSTPRSPSHYAPPSPSPSPPTPLTPSLFTPSLPHTLSPSHYMYMYLHRLLFSLLPSPTRTLTPSPLHSLTPSLPHSLTPSLPHSLTPSPLHSLTPSHHHSLTPSLPHPLTPSPPHTDRVRRGGASPHCPHGQPQPAVSQHQQWGQHRALRLHPWRGQPAGAYPGAEGRRTGRLHHGSLSKGQLPLPVPGWLPGWLPVPGWLPGCGFTRGVC